MKGGTVMKILICLIIGYLIGGINPSYIIARIKGFDIRKRGSGNAGASNALITMGKAIGIISALFDIAKAYFSVKIASLLFPEVHLAGTVCGSACIIGHIFPLLMGFKGGKGLACLGGIILAYDLRLFLVFLFVEIILALIVDYICIVPITASIIYPVLYGVMEMSVIAGMIVAVPCVIMLIKHKENMRRISMGTEAHLSFLWRRDEEIERLRGKMEEHSDK